MEFASDVTDKKQLIQYPNASRCAGYQCNSSYGQRMRIRRSCIANASAGLYTQYGQVTVVTEGVNYKLGDYIELVGGVPTAQPILLYVTTVNSTGIVAVTVVNSAQYNILPFNLNVVLSNAKSGGGSGATFKVLFRPTPTCVSCGS